MFHMLPIPNHLRVLLLLLTLLILILLLLVLLHKRTIHLLPTRNNIQVILLLYFIIMAEQEKTTNDTKNKCENMLQKKASMFSV